MKEVVRTTREPVTGHFKWEMFTTRGIPRDFHKYVAYACHYMINRLERVEPFNTTSLLPHFRTSDWVRVKGISTKLDVVVQPKSGFRLRFLMWQGPDTIDTICANYIGDVPNNKSFDGTDECLQGGYHLNGRLLTQHRNVPRDVATNERGGVETCLDSMYADLFNFQKKMYDHVDFDKHIHAMQLRAPWVSRLLDVRKVFVNRGNKPKSFTFHKFLRMSRLWGSLNWHRFGVVVEGVVDGASALVLSVLSELSSSLEVVGMSDVKRRTCQLEFAW